VIVLNEDHLRRLIRDYIRYYHEDRIHDSLDKDTPERRVIEPCGLTGSEWSPSLALAVCTIGTPGTKPREELRRLRLPVLIP
jgi:hypothetical protein